MEAVSYSLLQTAFGILKTLVVCASQNVNLIYDIDLDNLTNSLVIPFGYDRLSLTWWVMGPSSLCWIPDT